MLNKLNSLLDAFYNHENIDEKLKKNVIIGNSSVVITDENLGEDFEIFMIDLGVVFNRFDTLSNKSIVLFEINLSENRYN